MLIPHRHHHHRSPKHSFNPRWNVICGWLLKRINLAERFHLLIGSNGLLPAGGPHLNAAPVFGWSTSVEVIIQVMDFLRQRETSSDLCVLAPSGLHLFPHDILPEFTILSESIIQRGFYSKGALARQEERRGVQERIKGCEEKLPHSVCNQWMFIQKGIRRKEARMGKIQRTSNSSLKVPMQKLSHRWLTWYVCIWIKVQNTTHHPTDQKGQLKMLRCCTEN